MAWKIVLTADRGFMSSYRVTGFASVVPHKYLTGITKPIANYLFPLKSDRSGRMKMAPAGLARIEAMLINAGFSRNEVAIVDPRKLEKAIGKETKVVGISAMDPLDLAYGAQLAKAFLDLIGIDDPGPTYLSEEFNITMKKIEDIRKYYDFKVILGGSGTWQIIDRNLQNYFGIETVVEGEGEKVVGELFKDAVNGKELPRHVLGKPAKPEEVPEYLTPVNDGLVEVSRGCGRGCRFCSYASVPYRSFPIDRILREIKFQIYHGIKSISLQSEDFFRYGSIGLEPNEKVVELSENIASLDGLKRARPNFTTASSVLQKPNIVEKVADALGISKEGGVIEMGIETGSPKLLKFMMPGKPKPFDGDRWQEIVKEAVKLLNDFGWVVCGTIIVGTPWEDDEVLIEDLKLIRELRDYDCMIWPLPFVPAGLSRGETVGTEKVLSNPIGRRVVVEALLQTVNVIQRNYKSIINPDLSSKFFVSLTMGFMKKRLMKVLEETPDPLK